MHSCVHRARGKISRRCQSLALADVPATRTIDIYMLSVNFSYLCECGCTLRFEHIRRTFASFWQHFFCSHRQWLAIDLPTPSIRMIRSTLKWVRIGSDVRVRSVEHLASSRSAWMRFLIFSPHFGPMCSFDLDLLKLIFIAGQRANGVSARARETHETAAIRNVLFSAQTGSANSSVIHRIGLASSPLLLVAMHKPPTRCQHYPTYTPR